MVAAISPIPKNPFTRRLDLGSAAPVGVAFSGGPDSYLALRRTLAAVSRPVIALHVDHGLNPLSASWADAAATLAHSLGADFHRVAWTGAKPATGVPAKARAARHRLLADAARALGARVLVMGHTADDALENRALGQGALSEWAPSPVWPAGRSIMLLRPLLQERRRAIRAALAAEGVLGRLVDDPANADQSHPRIAARAEAADRPALDTPTDPRPFAFEALPGGAIRLGGEALTARSLALAMTAAGGGERLPRRAEVERLLAAGGGTLAGARLVREGNGVLIVRNAGEAARGGLAPLRVAPGDRGVFDGRFEVRAGERGVEIRALKGLAARLPAAEGRALSRLPSAVRPALPVALAGDRTSCPILAASVSTDVRELVAARLSAACGAIAHERDVWPAVDGIR